MIPSAPATSSALRKTAGLPVDEKAFEPLLGTQGARSGPLVEIATIVPLVAISLSFDFISG